MAEPVDEREEEDRCGCQQEGCPLCDTSCWTCGGEGWGIVGVNWDSDDYINGPYDGDIQQCPNCRGSGQLKDCWYF
jgi:hypothetical protein